MDQSVGRYRITGKLGKGAMGVVFLAEDPLLHRQVALKTIDLSVDEPDQREFLHDRLLRDARAAAALSHPHIVSVFDVVEEADRIWLVMEYIAGETLAQRMASGPMEPAFTLRILAEVAGALDYTHARGVIHRDIKPANIMIDPQGTAKIMDFGIARFSGGRTSTPTGMVMGTVEYMAPEQIKGEPLDGRADQFALAAVAYQMLTGSTMFGHQSFTTLTYKQVHEPPPLPRVRNPLLPPGVDDVLSRALRKQPAERFVNCAGFAAALAAAFAGDAPVAAPTGQTPAQPESKKWIWAGLAAAVVVIAGLAFAGIQLLHRQSPGNETVATVRQPAAPSPGAGTEQSPASQPAPVQPASPTPGAAAAAEKGQAGAAAEGSKSAASQAAGGQSTRSPAAGAQSQIEAMAPVEPPPPPPPDSRSPVANPSDRSLEEARAAIQRRDYSGAVALLSRVIESDPRSDGAYELRGLANQELKLFENAVRDYSADLRLNPTHAFALHQRGVCRVQLKQDDAALGDFDAALRLRPDFAATYVTRGYLFNRRGAYKRAIADFSQALALDPRNANAYRGRMVARQQIGDHAGAEDDAKAYLRLKN